MEVLRFYFVTKVIFKVKVSLQGMDPLSFAARIQLASEAFPELLFITELMMLVIVRVRLAQVLQGLVR